ncbi:MAG: hypothetical protein R3B06_27975 [Kofleriaceae bacterium]
MIAGATVDLRTVAPASNGTSSQTCGSSASAMDATRAVASDFFRASGGDPAQFTSARAPSLDEMLAQLAPVLGNPDEQ